LPDGRLTIDVFDVHGNHVEEPVDILLRNQTLSDAPVYRDVNVATTREITGLNTFPNGIYRLEVDGPSYHPVSRFVSIPPDGNGTVAVTLPVNPKKVVRVEFPPFRSANIPADAWTLLEHSANLLNFAGKTGKDLYDSLDDLRKAGFLNLVAKANRTRFASPAGDAGPSVLSFILQLIELRGDRFFATTNRELRSATVNGVFAELFHEVNEALHTPPQGFERDRSFKTFDHYGNLQLSFFTNAQGDVAVDMDIDDAQGFEHIFQVVGNLFGGPTHPYNIHEILIATQELDPAYALVIREPAKAAAG
jgi:hypothetical protein